MALALHFACASAALAGEAPSEHEQLAVVARQLELADRLAAQAAHVTPDGPARYHFDYRRLNTDLEAVRTGIADYLAPQRAQPRDPLPLDGDYRRTTDGQRRKASTP
ncbi:hypothetical protein AA0498_0090 [Acidomonas methanolica]|nr:RAQPRD family integrative conjugative element protein [Acidomonas methanolica]GBQ45587.1 hypothetical protein AA0498_0090 [Acidomonas methanolica]